MMCYISETNIESKTGEAREAMPCHTRTPSTQVKIIKKIKKHSEDHEHDRGAEWQGEHGKHMFTVLFFWVIVIFDYIYR